MNKLCVLICYFGKWPPYLDIYLKGCQNNPNVHFYIFTDIRETQSALPPNVFIKNLKIKQLETLIKEKTSIPCTIADGYKMCDFKPMYGHWFEDTIQAYDYWAFGDLDVIYGDIETHLRSKIDVGYDVVSLRAKWVSGSLCVFKNSSNINKLYLTYPKIRDVIQATDYVGFDETSGNWNEVFCEEFTFLNKPIENFSGLVLHAHADGKLKASFENLLKESIGKNDFVEYNNGEVKDKTGRLFILYHYITEKKNRVFSYPGWREVPDQFIIDDSGFFKLKEWKNRKVILRIYRQLRSIPRKSIWFIERAVRAISR